MKFIPNYDKDFYPMSIRLQEFRTEAKNSKSKKLSICVERNNEYNYIYTDETADGYKDYITDAGAVEKYFAEHCTVPAGTNN